MLRVGHDALGARAVRAAATVQTANRARRARERRESAARVLAQRVRGRAGSGSSSGGLRRFGVLLLACAIGRRATPDRRRGRGQCQAVQIGLGLVQGALGRFQVAELFFGRDLFALGGLVEALRGGRGRRGCRLRRRCCFGRNARRGRARHSGAGRGRARLGRTPTRCEQRHCTQSTRQPSDFHTVFPEGPGPSTACSRLDVRRSKKAHEALTAEQRCRPASLAGSGPSPRAGSSRSRCRRSCPNTRGLARSRLLSGARSARATTNSASRR